MREEIEERCLEIGQYIAEHGATVRAAARRFGVSKSSVHKDMHERLPELSEPLAAQVSQILRYNKAVRHLRGGEATPTEIPKQENRFGRRIRNTGAGIPLPACFHFGKKSG